MTSFSLDLPSTACFFNDSYIVIPRATNCTIIETFIKQTASQDQF